MIARAAARPTAALPVGIHAWRADEPNRCPGCAASNWLVGRQSAECAVCGSVAIITSPNSSTRLAHNHPEG